jgi:hypothetical protein
MNIDDLKDIYGGPPSEIQLPGLAWESNRQEN